VDYAKAQSSAELVNIAGFAAFDIILAAVLATVLAATTGGAGNTQAILRRRARSLPKCAM